MAPGPGTAADPKPLAEKKIQSKPAGARGDPVVIAVKPRAWVALRLVDEEGEPVAGEPWRLTFADGSKAEGTLGADGQVAVFARGAGETSVTFPGLDADAWEPLSADEAKADKRATPKPVEPPAGPAPAARPRPATVVAAAGDTLCGIAGGLGFADCSKLATANAALADRALRAGDIVTVAALVSKE